MENQPSKLEFCIEKIIFSSRWIQAPIYLLLIFILFAFLYHIAVEIVFLFLNLELFSEAKLVIFALTLCDLVLIANLVVVVIISGYENFVSKIDVPDDRGEPMWIKRLSPTGVKMKIASSIVAISSISLLKQFLELHSLSNKDLFWSMGIHIVFVLSALLIALAGHIEKNLK